MTEKQKIGFIEGVLVYAKIAEADKKYKSEDTEYSIGVIIGDEDEADAWDEKFAKQPAKKIKVSQFEERFKFALPEEFEGLKNVYQITLKRAAVVDGVEKFPQYRPKVFLETDDERVDITESRLIANGSRGKVSYRVGESAQHGDIARLNNVLIEEEDFIEYKSTSKEAGSEFGNSKPVKKEPANKAATEARKSKKEAEEEKEESTDEFGDSKPAKPSKPASKKATVKPKEEEPEDEEDSDAPY